jgi:hypothetical protein
MVFFISEWYKFENSLIVEENVCTENNSKTIQVINPKKPFVVGFLHVRNNSSAFTKFLLRYYANKHFSKIIFLRDY